MKKNTWWEVKRGVKMIVTLPDEYAADSEIELASIIRKKSWTII